MFERDLDGRVIREKTFDDRVFRYEYEGPFLKRTIDPLGQATAFEWDQNGAVIRRVHQDGTWAEFAYDPHLGSMLQATNANSKLQFEYDITGQLLRENIATKSGSFSVTSKYDAMGNRIQRATSTGHVADFGFTANGWLDRLITDKRRQVLFRYNNLGDEIARLLPAGGRMLHEYDPGGRVTSQRVIGGESLRKEGNQREYSYDPLGNLTAIRDRHWGSSRFEYDPSEQLLVASRGAGILESFRYNGIGNIASSTRTTDGGVSSSDWVYEHDSHLVQADGLKYEFDALGRVISRSEVSPNGSPQVCRFRWNSDDQLVEAWTPNGERWIYEYDAIGRRLAKHSMAVGLELLLRPLPIRSIEFFWDGDQVVEERDTAGRTRVWTYEPDSFVPFSVQEDNSTLYFVNDISGVPRELIRGDGSRAWAAQYTAWGRIADMECDTGVNCPIRFQGQWFDAETGLHYNLHRYYDPAAGRYLTPDPISLCGGINTHQYATNPMTWMDPWGLAKAKCPRKKRSQRKKVKRGSDAPAGGGIYSFRDRNGKRYKGSTNNFRNRMGGHIQSGRLTRGTHVTFTPISPGTRANGRARSQRGARRVRRFMEQGSIGTTSTGAVRVNPPLNPGRRGIPAVSQQNWDAHSGNWNSSYFN